MNYDFTQAWHWLQWTMTIFFLLSFIIATTDHGKEYRERSGPDKGRVQRHNAFISLTRIFIVVFILICGGFFA